MADISVVANLVKSRKQTRNKYLETARHAGDRVLLIGERLLIREPPLAIRVVDGDRPVTKKVPSEVVR
jgi:hypothetical protein